ncbi:Alpha/Beta hydrolase protein [Zychaea mexicana]|uniref:Alpha/Beta hydrolase protein n=1 Tax=Zychaea mexicana TaxID=64656 RepID=UPI0022FDF044|nr:Alpha/Beta hydrolase protein [Zychaea mexicana]KAI9488863.1 Alpha/Beta hydrolase protein [Zychaea mexicana]
MSAAATTITHRYYATEKSHFKELDLYIPPMANAKSPLLVFIHGGAWRSEDKADHAPLAEALVAHGFPVAVINYRLSLRDEKNKEAPPAVQHPLHIQDCKEAIEYLVHQHHGDKRYDPAQLYLIGHSAGAHIAMMLTLDPEYCCYATTQKVIAGVIGAQGIYDLALLLRKCPSYDFVPQAFGNDPSLYAAASPVTKQPAHHSDDLPPMLVVHSLEDTLVDVDQAHAMVDHLKAIGAASQVQLETENVKLDHYEMLYSKSFVDEIVAFVNRNSSLQ